jgi:hypothetical protein
MFSHSGPASRAQLGIVCRALKKQPFVSMGTGTILETTCASKESSCAD